MMQYLVRFIVLCLLTGLTGNHSLLADNAEKADHWQALSRQEKFKAETGPMHGRLQIGKFQQWELRLLDTEGQPVYPARISIDGGMPGHGHGLPTRPQATKYLGDGRWLIEGMKLNMAGEWVLVFGIQTETVSDRVDFTFTAGF